VAGDPQSVPPGAGTPGTGTGAARVAELEQELVAAHEELARLREVHARVLDELVRWRGTVLARWATAASGGSGGTGSGQPRHEVVRLREELAATQATLSWRVTAPLRAVQRRRLQGWR
jgi:hypothetical protein